MLRKYIVEEEFAQLSQKSWDLIPKHVINVHAIFY